MGRRQTEALFDVPTTEALIEQTDKQIGEAKEKRLLMREAVAEMDGYIARLEASRKALVKRDRTEKRTAQREEKARRGKTAAERAGRGNMDTALKLIRRRPMTKAEVTERMGINNGTVTYAIRALEEEGLIRETGQKINGSKEYDTATRRRVSRPGT